jgi:hypothetical protein
MKINVELSPKSLQETIKKLKQVEKLYTKGTLIKDFLEDVCMWVIDRANWYLENADLGELVKLQIRNGWEYEIGTNGAKIINSAEKAVFVEFGVGNVGFFEPHPNADYELYQYDVPYGSKDENGVWYFYTNLEDLDLPMSALNAYSKTFENDKRGRMFVATSGAKGVMYAYNALIDARNDLQNPNGELAQIWRTIQKQYIERYIR